MGHIEVVQLLIRNGADIEAKDRNQYTPLHAAAAGGKSPITPQKLHHVHHFATSHLFCLLGMADVCEYLLNTGAQVGACNIFGNTALHVACLNGQLNVCELLLNRGADIEVTNSRRETPLHLAAASTRGADCLNFLIEKKANIDAKRADGRTPLHVTAIHGRFTRSKTLIDAGKNPSLDNIYYNYYSSESEAAYNQSTSNMRIPNLSACFSTPLCNPSAAFFLGILPFLSLSWEPVLLLPILVSCSS